MARKSANRARTTSAPSPTPARAPTPPRAPEPPAPSSVQPTHDPQAELGQQLEPRSQESSREVARSIAEVDRPGGWVYALDGVAPFDRLLLLAIADHADEDEWFRGCLVELSSWTGMDQAAVEQHRLSLISRGLLEYRETREDAPERECTAHWCAPEMRDEHPQRVRVERPSKRELPPPEEDREGHQAA